MKRAVGILRLYWALIFTTPWRLDMEGPYLDVLAGTPLDSTVGYLFVWVVGWIWALAGLALGAFVAPSLMTIWGLTNSPFQDYVVIAISVLSSLLAQISGILAFTLVVGMIFVIIFVIIIVITLFTIVISLIVWGIAFLAQKLRGRESPTLIDCSLEVVDHTEGLLDFFSGSLDGIIPIVAFILIALLPLAAIGFAFSQYVMLEGASRGIVTVAILGAFIVKAIIFPAIKGFFVGIIIKRFFKWVRGEKSKG